MIYDYFGTEYDVLERVVVYKIGIKGNYDGIDPDEESVKDYIDEDGFRYIMSIATVGTIDKGIVFLEKVKDTAILK